MSLIEAGGGDRGLLEVTDVSGDMGKFRTPPLRNVEYSGPYMHDGTVATLREDWGSVWEVN